MNQIKIQIKRMKYQLHRYNQTLELKQKMTLTQLQMMFNQLYIMKQLKKNSMEEKRNTAKLKQLDPLHRENNITNLKLKLQEIPFQPFLIMLKKSQKVFQLLVSMLMQQLIIILIKSVIGMTKVNKKQNMLKYKNKHNLQVKKVIMKMMITGIWMMKIQGFMIKMRRQSHLHLELQRQLQHQLFMLKSRFSKLLLKKQSHHQLNSIVNQNQLQTSIMFNQKLLQTFIKANLRQQLLISMLNQTKLSIFTLNLKKKS